MHASPRGAWMRAPGLRWAARPRGRPAPAPAAPPPTAALCPSSGRPRRPRDGRPAVGHARGRAQVRGGRGTVARDAAPASWAPADLPPSLPTPGAPSAAPRLPHGPTRPSRARLRHRPRPHRSPSPTRPPRGLRAPRPSSAPPPPTGSTATGPPHARGPTSWSKPSSARGSASRLATRVARRSKSTRRSPGRPPSATCCAGTSRAKFLRPRDMRRRRGTWACAWRRRGLARRIWSPASPTPCSIPCPSSRSRAKCRAA